MPTKKQTLARFILSVLRAVIALDLIPMQTALYLFNTGDRSVRHVSKVTDWITRRMSSQRPRKTKQHLKEMCLIYILTGRCFLFSIQKHAGCLHF